MTIAPALAKYSIVGIDERIRVSSVIVLPSRGTLRSHRRRTFLPFRSVLGRSVMDFLVLIVVVFWFYENRLAVGFVLKIQKLPWIENFI